VLGITTIEIADRREKEIGEWPEVGSVVESCGVRGRSRAKLGGRSAPRRFPYDGGRLLTGPELHCRTVPAPKTLVRTTPSHFYFTYPCR
jgi:hypothetical protein